MSSPAAMEASVRRVEATRAKRRQEPFPELKIEEKRELLQEFHPDFNLRVKRRLRVGVNQGDLAPQELADYLEAPSRVDPGRSISTRSTTRPTSWSSAAAGAGCRRP